MARLVQEKLDAKNSELGLNLSLFYNSQEEEWNYGHLMPNPQAVSLTEEKGISEYRLSFPPQFSKLQLSVRESPELKAGALEDGFFLRSKGMILHLLFERITTKDDILPACKSLICEGLMEPENMRPWRELLEEKLGQDPWNDWFSGNWKIMNERPLLVPGRGFRIPDRVMLKGKQVIVLDYKFGTVVSDHHQEQVRDYVSLLREMDIGKVEGYVWYVVGNQLVPVS